MAAKKDKINPSHYRPKTDAKNKFADLQVIDIIEIYDLNFQTGNAVKYILRAGKKEEEGYDLHAKAIEDLEKASWYIQRELERLKSEQKG